MLVNGFLGVDKPSGCTSHDVVAQVRKHFGIRKVGHTGTLDPMATGVLVLCLGAFTRLSSFLSDLGKAYRATIRLGIETDTFDAEGTVLRESSDFSKGLPAVQAVLERFKGEIDQIPPMFSAVRQDGKRLYELARKGQEVKRLPRKVCIYGLDVVEFTPPFLLLDAHCSKGTYIRSLAADIGTELGCGAHLSALQRTAVGSILLGQCVALDEVLEMSDQTTLESHFLDPAVVLSHFPTATLDSDQMRLFLHGNSVADGFNRNVLGPVCVYDNQSRFLGLGRHDGERTLRPFRVISRSES